MSKKERKAAAKAHDMSSVSQTLATEVRSSVRNLLSGNIVRALLVQLQFVSSEVYRSMATIDDILAANTATIQALSLFPAFFLLAGIVRALKAGAIALLSESVKSTETVHSEMAAVVSEMSHARRLDTQATLGLLPLGSSRRGWRCTRRVRTSREF